MFGAELEPLRFANVHRHFASHCVVMPRWHRLLMIVALLLVIGGVVGWGWARSKAFPSSVSVPPAGSGSATALSEQGVGDQREVELPLVGKVSVHALKIGASVVGGFIVGWLLRAFIKLMLLVVLAIVLMVLGVLYFTGHNLDLSGVREHYPTALVWLSDQGVQALKTLWHQFPSTGGGAVGAFLGFRRG